MRGGSSSSSSAGSHFAGQFIQFLHECRFLALQLRRQRRFLGKDAAKLGLAAVVEVGIDFRPFPALSRYRLRGAVEFFPPQACRVARGRE